MQVLIIGSGGREHALAWKIAQSPLVDQVLAAPGSPGLDLIGPCFDVAVDDIDGLEQLCLQIEPDLVVVGPEVPLALGLGDRLRARGFDVFGPDRKPAQLEASKAFAKALMTRLCVPTARYGAFTEVAPALAFLDTLSPPYVLKADGLAAGKGVIIAATRAEADAEVADLLSGRFGAASSTLVIEEFMDGEEVSLFALTDGDNFLTLPAVQDHKRVGEGDTGPNTGGMGAYGPASILTPALRAEAERTIIAPILEGLQAAGTPFRGALFAGLMITPDGPKVVEFNCRFGDPEAQVLMRLIRADIVPILLACATGGLKTADFASLLDPADCEGAAVAVVMAARGYPGTPERGSPIRGMGKADHLPGVQVFHAGTTVGQDGEVLSAGGRVLSVTATGATLRQAVDAAYAGVDALDAPGLFCRRDIGWRALGEA
jgi:phosphoribosylamine--glycine ligase